MAQPAAPLSGPSLLRTQGHGTNRRRNQKGRAALELMHRCRASTTSTQIAENVRIKTLSALEAARRALVARAGPVRQGLSLLGRIAPLRRFRRGGAFAPPLKAKFFVTHRCNLACRHCHLWADQAHPDELSTEEYRSIFERNPALRVISFSGGEPSLRADLAELIAMAGRSRPAGALVSVNLNGYDPDATVAALRTALAALPESVRLIASVSLDGPAGIHDAIRRRDGAHRRALETARRLVALGDPRLQVRRNLCVSPFNLQALEQVLADVSASHQPLQVCFYQAAGHYRHQRAHRDLVPGFKEEMRRRIATLRRLAPPPDPIGWIFLELAVDFFTRPVARQVLPCYSGLAAVSCDPTGRIDPCINYERSMGGLRDFDYRLDALLRSPAAQRTRAAIAAGACPGCWTPNEAYTSILCNLPDPSLATALVRARLRASPADRRARP